MLRWSSSLSVKDGLTFPVSSTICFHRGSSSVSCSAAFRRWHLLKGRSSWSAVPQIRQNCSYLVYGSLRLYLLCPSQISRLIFVGHLCICHSDSSLLPSLELCWDIKVIHSTPPFALVEEAMWILVISEMAWGRGERSCGSQKPRWTQSDLTVLTGCYLQ